jgi:Fuc2NAc and GlcNAc transferase
MSLALSIASGIAFGVSALGTYAVRTVAPRLGLVDRANARSSHVGEVARGGGLGLILGAAAGLVMTGVVCTSACGAVLLGAGVLAAVGLADDRFRLPPLVRLAVHTATAVGLVLAVGGLVRLPLPAPFDIPLGVMGTVLAAVWIVAVVNFYNFLDGIDGLAGLQAVITGGGVALAAWNPFTAGLGLCLAGASLGFLLHNWSPARVFLGDVGSGAVGFCLAAAPLLAPPPLRPAAVLFVGLSLFLFLADATWTLFIRIRRGERLHEAHRQHLYQRLVVAGWSHARVTSLLGLGAVALTAVALLAWWEPAWAWASVFVAVAAFGGEVLLVRARERAVGVVREAES